MSALNIHTLIILRTQFSNRFEGPKPASLTYSAVYYGNDRAYVEYYNENLVDEVATQCDFWECVNRYCEEFFINVKVLDEVDEKEKIEEHLTKLITDKIVKLAGRPLGSSFRNINKDS